MANNQKLKLIVNALGEVERTLNLGRLPYHAYGNHIAYYNQAIAKNGIFSDFHLEIFDNLNILSKDNHISYLNSLVNYLSDHNKYTEVKSASELWGEVQNSKMKGFIKDEIDDDELNSIILLTGARKEENIADYLDFEFYGEGVPVILDILKHIHYTIYTSAVSYPKQLLDRLKSETSHDSYVSNSQNTAKSVKKIKWKGSMKQLAELFVQLEAKGFITFDVSGQLKDNVKILSSLFDLSDVKKDKESDSVDSLYKLFNSKRHYSEFMDENGYDDVEKKYKLIYTPRSLKVFSGILSNNS